MVRITNLRAEIMPFRSPVSWYQIFELLHLRSIFYDYFFLSTTRKSSLFKENLISKKATQNKKSWYMLMLIYLALGSKVNKSSSCCFAFFSKFSKSVFSKLYCIIKKSLCQKMLYLHDGKIYPRIKFFYEYFPYRIYAKKF